MGHGCKLCNEYQKKTTEEFVIECKNIHKAEYDYSKTDYKGDAIKVEIVCRKHGSFYQCPKEHLRQHQGCPKCGKDRIRYTTEEFIHRATTIHGDKYNYSKSIYVGNQQKIEIVCKVHGSFRQKARDHLLGCGCQKCHRRVSKIEVQFLDTLNISEEFRQFPIPKTRYKTDGYDIETNTVYEFLGDYWHGNPKVKDQNKFICAKTKTTFGDLYKKTLLKFKILNGLGYNIKYVWETDWNNWKKNPETPLKFHEYNKQIYTNI